MFSQSGQKWATGGNSVSNGDFFGTTNAYAIYFRTNNIQRASISSTGILQLNSVAGTGNGFVWVDANGNFSRTSFPNDSNKVLTGNGTFRTFSSASGWAHSGNNLYNTNSGFVGIGTSSPQYILDVNGSARVNGTLYAMGLVLATKMQADTFKSTSLISINNNLNFSGGVLNDIYTSSGDLRFQSNIGNQGNILLNVGTTGNVGVGIFSPQYKFDVNGDARFSGKIYSYRIVPLPGDGLIRFGDSTIVIAPQALQISTDHPFIQILGSPQGISVGWQNGSLVGGGYAYGIHSLALGNNVQTTSAAPNSIVLGSGLPGNFSSPYLQNTIPNSLMVGFNSTIPTLFVGGATSNSNGYGKVGVQTTNPLGDFQVGNGWTSTSMGGTFGSANSPLYSSSYFGLNVAYGGLDHWTAQGNGSANGGVAMLGTLNGTFEVVNFPTQGGNDQVFTDAQIAQHTYFEVRPPTATEPLPKVVIGTNPETMYTPGTYRLYVQDGIMTEKLKVWPQASWADYVFDSSYVLTPLDTVANYIHANHHLQGVPSSEEVKKNGTDVGDTEATLLAKVEELTLYMIQLQKQNADMQKEIDALKKK